MKTKRRYLTMAFMFCIGLSTFLESAALAQGNRSASFDKAALKETTRISNNSGTRIVADFYATSKIENVALSPPSMIATYAALAHVAKGRTKQDLQSLLHLNGVERPAFAMLNRYLSNQSTYDSVGLMFVRTGLSEIDDVVKKELKEKFATIYGQTDFSHSDVEKINKRIVEIVQPEDFLENSPAEIVQANPEACFVVCSAVSIDEGWPWRMRSGNSYAFNFDSGRKQIDFLKGIAKTYQDVTVNNQSGYLFSLGTSDLIIVKCRNGEGLKQLAKMIASDGLRIQPGRKIAQPTMLLVPGVDFETEFDFRNYAIAKGCSAPFTDAAEYTFVENSRSPIPCDEAKVFSSFLVGEIGISLQQVTVAMGIPDMGREQRLRNNIIIDSPYMMLVVERQLGTVLGMAFIAAPNSDDDEDFDESEFFSWNDSSPGFGVTPEDTADSKPVFGASGRNGKNGIVISSVRRGFPAQISGLEPGDEILAVNGRSVRTTGEWIEATHEAMRQGKMTVRVINVRNKKQMDLQIKGL